ncbi:MAG: multidrug transporter subunit MdtD [Candidatus Caldatribacteriota bacterium]
MQDSKTNNTLLWLVAVGFFMETLDATIVNTAIPTMAKDLGVSPLSMQSVVVSYALTLAVCIPASGWLTDRFGVRKIYLSAISIFTFGSLLCGLAPNLTTLIIARVIQAIGGSMMLPVGRLAILRAFPGERYLPALSFVTMPALIGPLIGPPLGGWISQTFSWHWIFLVNFPIGIAGLFATYKAMPDDHYTVTRPFDILGFLQITLFMVSVSVALDAIATKQLSSGLIYFLFIFGFASLASYALRAVRITSPLISFKLFEDRSFSIGILGNIFSRLGTTSITFLIPLYLQLTMGHTPLESGMAMFPIAIAAILAKRTVTPLVMRYGYRKFLVSNTILCGLTIASFCFLSSIQNKVILWGIFFLFGIVNSMQFTAMNTLTMKDLKKEYSSQGNTLFSIVQMMAMSFSVATAASLVATFRESFEKADSFHYTFICMGAITCCSTWIFFQIGRKTKITQKKLDELIDQSTN